MKQNLIKKNFKSLFLSAVSLVFGSAAFICLKIFKDAYYAQFATRQVDGSAASFSMYRWLVLGSGGEWIIAAITIASVCAFGFPFMLDLMERQNKEREYGKDENH